MIIAKSIQQKKSTQDVLDHPFLKQLAIDYIQKLSGRVWTDYNVHDPGVTLLEILAYAITDLGFRTRNKVPSILAEPGVQKVEDTFYSHQEILFMAPLTQQDYAMVFLTIEGVKNAKLLHSATNPDFTGIYDLILEIEPDADKEAISMEARSLFESNTLHLQLATEGDVDPKRLHGHRNLCESLDEIRFLERSPIKFEIVLELASGTYVNQFLAALVALLREALCPAVRYHQIQDLLASGTPVEEVFSGPSLPYGRILDRDLQLREQKTVLRVSDLVRAVMGLKGVLDIRELVIIDQYAVHHKWLCPIDSDTAPFLDLENSWISIYNHESKDLLHKSNLQGKRGAIGDISAIKTMHKMSMPPLPVAKFLNLEQYYSIQNEFPAIYGIGEAGLLAADPPRRKGLAKQFKGYLMFFDQVLANYLSQLAHLRQVFSIDQVPQTYHFQALLDVPGAEYLCLPFLQHFLTRHAMLDDPGDPGLLTREWQHFKAGFLAWQDQRLGGRSAPGRDAGQYQQRLEDFKKSPYKDHIAAIQALDQQLYFAIEDEMAFLDRRNRMLNHLLARFAVDTKAYEFTRPENPNPHRQIALKQSVLQNIPRMSRQRGVGASLASPADLIPKNLRMAGVEEILHGLLNIPTPAEKQESKNQGTLEIEKASVPVPDPNSFEALTFPSAKSEDEALELLFRHCTETKNWVHLPDAHQLHVTHQEKLVALMDLPANTDPNNWTEVREAMIEKIARESRHFESLHLIEHLHLRPEKSANFFGFAVYDLTGEMLLFRTDKFQDFETRNRDLQALLKAGRDREQYISQKLRPHEYKLVIKVGNNRLEGPGTYNSQSQCDSAISAYIRAFEALHTHHATHRSSGLEDFRIEEEGQALQMTKVQRLRALYELAIEEENYRIGELTFDNSDPFHRSVRTEVVLKRLDGNAANKITCKYISRRKIELGDESQLNQSSEVLKEFVRHQIHHFQNLYLANVNENPSIKFLTRNHELYENLHDPYSHVVTLLFPAWPTRFQDANFRSYIWKMVHSEVPCHLVVNVKWLPYSAMKHYQDLNAQLHAYRAKLQALRAKLHDSLTQLQDLQAKVQDLRTEAQQLLDSGGAADMAIIENDIAAMENSIAAKENDISGKENELRKWERKSSKAADKVLQLITDVYD